MALIGCWGHILDPENAIWWNISLCEYSSDCLFQNIIFILAKIIIIVI